MEFPRGISIPLDMTQTQKQNGRARVFEPGRCELTNVTVLESLLQSDVPESAFDSGKRFIVPILEAACHERRIRIAHVLYAQRNCGVVKPPLPVAAAILGCRYRDNILLLAVLAGLHVFAAVLGEARYFRR